MTVVWEEEDTLEDGSGEDLERANARSQGEEEEDTLGRAGAAALAELADRLEDPKRRKELSAPGLLQVAILWGKVLERREATKPPVREQPVPISVVLDNADMPIARKKEIIRAEIEVLKMRRKSLDAEIRKFEAMERSIHARPG